MYALIYDEYDLSMHEKEIISVHRTRAAADQALKKRQQRLGKRVWECNTRIVWVSKKIRAGEKITPDMFDTWAPGEKIPAGDQIPDGD